MTDWSDFVAAGLLGSGRAPIPPLSDGTAALQDVLSGLDGRTVEARWLATAAVASTWRRAGTVAEAPAPALPALAPAEERPECSPTASSHLDRLLNEPALAHLLPEWLAALRAAGRCLSHAWLPEMLDLACEKDDLRPLVLPVLGQRGRWLAAQHSNWTQLLLPSERAAIFERWTTAAFPDRLFLLRSIRETDPGLGRELLASTWEQEPPRERAAFLAALSINLSMADEPLAEASLDDRRKEVREVAVDLAASLPDSRLCRRMTERLRPLLELVPAEKPSLRNLGHGKLASLLVSLPEACDKAMQRDGVEPKPRPHPRLGEQAQWLVQMLGAAPPRFWIDAWNLTPAVLVPAAAESAWREPLWIGWQVAARRHSDADWAIALVDAAVARLGRLPGVDSGDTRSDIRQTQDIVAHLWPLLPADRQEAFTLQAFARESQALHDGHLAAFLLTLSLHVWSEALGRTVLRSLQQRIRKSHSATNPDWQLRGWLKKFASSMPPSLAGEAAEGWERGAVSWGYWGPAIDEFLRILQFRHDMLVALTR